MAVPEDQSKLDAERLQRELFEKLRRDSRRSAILGFIGGLVVMGGLAMTYFATLQARENLKTEVTKTVTLQTEVTDKTQVAVTATKKAEAVVKVLNDASADLQSQKGVSATATSALNKAFQENPAAAKLIARVYIHLHSEPQRNTAVGLAKTLRAAGFLVPGIDLQDKVGRLSHTEIHYYTDDSVSVSDAKAIANTLTAAGTPTIAKKSASSTPQPTRSYGLWLATDLQ